MSDSVDQGDLRKIKGIGPQIEARLKGAGISTPGHLARTPVNEIVAALQGIRGAYDAGRISREGWLPQAAALAAAATDATREAEPAERVTHNFTVEVQLAVATREIMSAKVIHVQTRDEATWGGWDGQRLIAFIEDRSGAQQPVAVAPPDGEPSTATEQPQTPLRVVKDRSAELGLHTFAMVGVSGPDVPVSGSVTAAFSFDPATVLAPAHQRARAKVDIYARELPLGKSFLVGSAVADINPGDPVGIEVPCDLPSAACPVALFAAVQLFAVTGPMHKPSAVLPEARLTVSRERSAMAVNSDGLKLERPNLVASHRGFGHDI